MSWSGESELQELLGSVTKPSQSKIMAVTEFAVHHVRHYKQVVHLVERFVRKSTQTQQQFAGIYMIDAICKGSHKKAAKDKNYKDVYTSRFAEHLAEICLLVIEAQGSEGRRIIRKLCTMWRERKAFDLELVDKLAEECGPANSDDEDEAPKPRRDEPDAKRRRVEILNANDPRRKHSSTDHSNNQPTIPSPVNNSSPHQYAYNQPPNQQLNHQPHQQPYDQLNHPPSHPQQHQQQHYDPHQNQWQQPPVPLPMPPMPSSMPMPPMSMPMPPMPPMNQPSTPSNMQHPPHQPPVAIPPPSLSAAFADDYSDEEDENEEARAERMRKRIEETKARLSNK